MNNIFKPKHFSFPLALEVVYMAHESRSSTLFFFRHSAGVVITFSAFVKMHFLLFLRIFFLTHARWPYTSLIGLYCMYLVQRQKLRIYGPISTFGGHKD